MLARYEGAYAATTLTVMGDRGGFEWVEQPAWGEIDKHVAAKWQRMKILPSDLCSDEEFLRRVYLDLTGLPPKPLQLKLFLADPTDSKAKREAFWDKTEERVQQLDKSKNELEAKETFALVKKDFEAAKGLVDASSSWRRAAIVPPALPLPQMM